MTVSCELVVIGGSAGAIGPLSEVLRGLPFDFPAAVVIVQHSDPSRKSLLAPILARASAMPVVAALEGDELEPGRVYIVPPNRHATVTDDRRIHLFDGTRIRHVRSSANPLFESAALVYGTSAVAIVLSGTGFDATDGVQAIKHHGGAVIVQSVASAQHGGMPKAAIATGAVDYVLAVQDIPAALRLLAGVSGTS